jgi:Icc-related predicted phosphoesterase
MINIMDGCHYLCDSGVEIEGFKIWGTPWTKTFPQMNRHCKAFTMDTDEELGIKFSLIPDDTNILISHCPPFGIFDGIEMRDSPDGTEFHTGSKSLLKHVKERVKPALHVYGHIHEHGGKTHSNGTTIFANASIVDEVYKPVYKPVRVVL